MYLCTLFFKLFKILLFLGNFILELISLSNKALNLLLKGIDLFLAFTLFFMFFLIALSAHF